jgi:hypothetical protein
MFFHSIVASKETEKLERNCNSAKQVGYPSLLPPILSDQLFPRVAKIEERKKKSANPHPPPKKTKLFQLNHFKILIELV